MDHYGSSVVALRGGARARSPGASRPCTTTSGTTTCPAQPRPRHVRARRRARSPPSCRRRRWASSSCSTARPASRSSRSRSAPVPQRRRARRGALADAALPDAPAAARAARARPRRRVRPLVLRPRLLPRAARGAAPRADLHAAEPRSGTIVVPGNAGGSNWGGIAVDPERRIVVANVMNLPFLVRLVPRAEFAARRSSAATSASSSRRRRARPTASSASAFLSPLGAPCTKPPWGTLAAVDLDRGEILWQRAARHGR